MADISESSQRVPGIEKMIEYLNARHSDVLNNLRTKYPEQANLLRIGEVWGKETSTDALRASAEACLEWLDVVIEDCAAYLPVLSARIRSASKFQFTSQVVTTIGSASVLTAIAGHFTDITVASAVLTLIGSLCTLFAQFLTGTHQSGGSLLTHHDNLVKYQIEAQQIRRKLKQWIERGCAGSEGAKLITQGETLCERAEQIFPMVQLVTSVKATA